MNFTVINGAPLAAGGALGAWLSPASGIAKATASANLLSKTHTSPARATAAAVATAPALTAARTFAPGTAGASGRARSEAPQLLRRWEFTSRAATSSRATASVTAKRTYSGANVARARTVATFREFVVSVTATAKASGVLTAAYKLPSAATLGRSVARATLGVRYEFASKALARGGVQAALVRGTHLSGGGYAIATTRADAPIAVVGVTARAAASAAASATVTRVTALHGQSTARATATLPQITRTRHLRGLRTAASALSGGRLLVAKRQMGGRTRATAAASAPALDLKQLLGAAPAIAKSSASAPTTSRIRAFSSRTVASAVARAYLAGGAGLDVFGPRTIRPLPLDGRVLVQADPRTLAPAHEVYTLSVGEELRTVTPIRTARESLISPAKRDTIVRRRA